ncbi:hypothetical protein E2C01_040394 [Portunus trituberculatus]|uniref:Uncharacterized protein n=1 Tax=Portunus trituberculatus TaxID=210409 RepID=A0A5B7FN70_PORTR|nr:hypothetical protein [Portunus trituberculatus]
MVVMAEALSPTRATVANGEVAASQLCLIRNTPFTREGQSTNNLQDAMLVISREDITESITTRRAVSASTPNEEVKMTLSKLRHTSTLCLTITTTITTWNHTHLT